MEGVKLLRGRKEELKRKSLAAHNLYEDVLSSSLEEADLGLLRDWRSNTKGLRALKRPFLSAKNKHWS